MNNSKFLHDLAVYLENQGRPLNELSKKTGIPRTTLKRLRDGGPIQSVIRALEILWDELYDQPMPKSKLRQAAEKELQREDERWRDIIDDAIDAIDGDEDTDDIDALIEMSRP